MKIVIIGDIHGRKVWKDIITAESNADYFVFLGDYFDPYDLSTPKEMIDNFKNILKFKKDNQEKVKLLVGNHDLHYISPIRACSRYSQELNNLLKSTINLKELLRDGIIQLCFKIPINIFNIWCVHAGFTNTWLRDNRLQLNESELNNHFIVHMNSVQHPYSFIDKGLRTDCYGDDVFQSPLWVRPHSLLEDCPFGVYQIVGHTQNNWIENINISKVTLCDSLAFKKYYVYEFNKKSSSIFENFEMKTIDN